MTQCLIMKQKLGEDLHNETKIEYQVASRKGTYITGFGEQERAVEFITDSKESRGKLKLIRITTITKEIPL